MEREISGLMQGLHQAMHKRLCNTELPAEHLTLQQLRTLHLVRQRPGIIMGDVAAEFQITKASVNALIKRLCRDGWLTRTQDRKDRRITHLRLSPLAASKIKKTLNRKRTIAAAALASLSDADQKTLRRILRTMVENLK